MPSFGGGGGGQTQPATFSQGGNPAPYIPTAQGSADTNYQNLLQGLINPSMAALNNIGQLPASQYYPQAQDLTAMLTQNPYANTAIAAAANASPLGEGVGTQTLDIGQYTFPYLAGNVTAGVPGLQGAGNQILNTAFDPQQALYNQLLQQNQSQVNAQNAMSGLAGTPYGANLANQANTNFNLGWQNQLLGRQQQGISGANTAFQGVRGLEQGGADILGQGANLANMGAQQIYNYGALPYQASSGIAQTGLQGLSNLINLGNQQFTIPQDALNYLANYMRLGQGSSELAGSLGNAGFNQNQQGLSNIVGAAGLGSQALFGSGGPFGSSGLIGGLGGGAGLGGLFGGGFGGAGLGAATDAAASGAGLDALAFLPFL